MLKVSFGFILPSILSSLLFTTRVDLAYSLGLVHLP